MYFFRSFRKRSTFSSLVAQEVQSRVYHPISLAQLDYLSPGPLQEMLSVYDALYRELEDLHLLAV